MGFIRSSLLVMSTALLGLFATAPTSTTYHLQSYGIGSGGTSGSTSTTYGLTGIAGEQGDQASSTTYKAGTGLIPTQQANTPGAPTLTNAANTYDKLHITLDTGGNPSDTIFAIAISTDNFASNFNYVQSDHTVGATLSSSNYQTYTNWGGASGFNIIGLLPSTVYTVKVKAQQGKYTESAYSVTASASTVSPSLTFEIDVSATDSHTSPPYSTSFSNLLPNTVVNSSQYIWVSLETNGDNGGTVFISSQNTGLVSAAGSHTINSATADLSAVSEGYGAQLNSQTQTSGGPLAAQSPYTGTAQNVGIVDTAIRPLFVATSPIVGGRGSIVLKARATNGTPAAPDYSDILTLIASASF